MTAKLSKMLSCPDSVGSAVTSGQFLNVGMKTQVPTRDLCIVCCTKSVTHYGFSVGQTVSTSMYRTACETVSGWSSIQMSTL